MFILDSGCGWIPDPPIKFMYHIINLIKNLTPVILIIMGSLDFGKAVMSQKEDEIKKAQGAFIKKLIAGAAVFFVVVFARWMIKIIGNAGGDTGNAFNCVSLLLTGSYSSDDTTYYDGPNRKTTNPTTEYDWRTDVNTNKSKCFEECRLAGQSREYCNKHCDNTPSGTWDECMTPCLEVQSEAYCNKHCEVYFNGGSNYNPTATTNNSNNNSNNNNNNNNNNSAWDACMTPCLEVQNEAYCSKHCETELNGGSS